MEYRTTPTLKQVKHLADTLRLDDLCKLLSNTQLVELHIVIEAFQMTEERRATYSMWPVWLRQAWDKEAGEKGAVYPTVKGARNGTVSIETLEGLMLVNFGDWIIRGIQGELYPCAPDIFEATYDPVI